MKVVHVTTSLSLSGAQIMLRDLLLELRNERLESVVVSLMNDGPVARDLKAAGLIVHELGWKRTLPSLPELLSVRELVRRLRPDCIVGWMYHGNLAASWCAASVRGRVPVLWNIHHTVVDIRDEKPLTRGIIRAGGLLARGVERIVYVARSAAESHQRLGYPTKKTIVIPNGFRTDRFRPDSRVRAATRSALGIGDDFLVGIVGRWHPLKDHHNFFRAAAIVAARNQRVRFLAVGVGLDSHNSQLVEMIESMGIADRLHLTGERHDVPNLMNALDLLVLSSRSEAFPIVVGEAMSCGVPVVATDVGDVAMIVGDTGTVVPPQDPEALAESILRSIALPARKRAELGLRARQRIVQEFSIEAVASRYATLFREASAKPATVARRERGVG